MLRARCRAANPVLVFHRPHQHGPCVRLFVIRLAVLNTSRIFGNTIVTYVRHLSALKCGPRVFYLPHDRCANFCVASVSVPAHRCDTLIVTRLCVCGGGGGTCFANLGCVDVVFTRYQSSAPGWGLGHASVCQRGDASFAPSVNNMTL
jgi:hypothetical protein